MKKVILTTIVICLYFVALSQQHYHSTNIDKFVGSWIYHQDGKEVEITLKVVPIKVVQRDDIIDVLEGVYIYKLNGKTIDDSKKHKEISLSMGLVQDRADPNLVKISYFDELKQKTGAATLTFVPGEPDKLRWYLINNTEGLRLKGQPKYDYRFTIPESMILERKK